MYFLNNGSDFASKLTFLRSNDSLAKYKAASEKRMKDAELKEKSKPKKETTQSKGTNMWLIGGLGALIAFPFMVILNMAKKYDD